jgi:hypothetical protein
LSLEELGESVTTIVGVMDFTDLNGVISQVVMNDEGKIL